MGTKTAAGHLTFGKLAIDGKARFHTVKTRILDDLITTLLGVNGTGSYSRTIRQASRSVLMFSQQPRGDVAFIASTREAKDNLLNSITTCQLTVMLALVVEERPEHISLAVDDLIGDAIKAILADETRGGLAISTNVISVEEQVTEELAPIGCALMEIEIVYRHSRTNPYTAA